MNIPSGSVLDEEPRHKRTFKNSATNLILNQFTASKPDANITSRRAERRSVAGPNTKPYGFVCRQRPLYPITLSTEEVKYYENAFKNYDINGDGVISVSELSLLLDTVGLRPSEEEVINMIACVDIDNDGSLGVSEFIKLMSKQHNPFVTPRSQFDAVFRTFDEDKNGFLSRGEFKNLLFSLGQRISEVQLDQLVNDLDKNKDGLISRREFLKIFLYPNDQDETLL